MMISSRALLMYCLAAQINIASGAEPEMNTADDLYNQCSIGIGANLGMKPAVDSACINYFSTTYKWMLANPRKVGALRPYAQTTPPLAPSEVASLLAGRFVNSMPFTHWYKRCPLAISARDAAISLIQQLLAVNSPITVYPEWYVIPPGSPNFPSPPIRIGNVQRSKTACSTSDPRHLTDSEAWGRECRAANEAFDLQQRTQRQEIETAKLSQCLPSADEQLKSTTR